MNAPIIKTLDNTPTRTPVSFAGELAKESNVAGFEAAIRGDYLEGRFDDFVFVEAAERLRCDSMRVAIDAAATGRVRETLARVFPGRTPKRLMVFRAGDVAVQVHEGRLLIAWSVHVVALFFVPKPVRTQVAEQFGMTEEKLIERIGGGRPLTSLPLLEPEPLATSP